MYTIALKMLTEDKAKFIGMILSLSFSTIIIIQQMATFMGTMRRTYSTISDTPQAEIWVMNPSVKMIDDINPIRSIDLWRVRSIEGVQWAMPFYLGKIRAKLLNGQFQLCNLYGIDSATFVGAPHTMIEGRVEDLRKPFSIIVNQIGAEEMLAQDMGPDKPKRPLSVGDTLELNDRRATVVGICEVTRTFLSQPVIYTTFERAQYYSPFERKQLSFIMAHAADGVSAKEVCKRIDSITHLKAYTKEEFENKTVFYYLTKTGLPINFGIAVLLGILIGVAITGQIFFNFTSDNLQYYSLFNAMGASHFTLAKITLLQGVWVAFLGWGIGAGLASFLGFATRNTQLAFYMPWALFLGSGILIFTTCVVFSLISINRIFKIQLGTMFK
ncbi:MAG TPA: ABC transporter permease [Candidatus Babeliales bacterium]|nr:ABC transporter permease [Candidatus Babeliales bacterium]